MIRHIARTDARGRRAFTLIELLVVVAIIAILAALLMPAVRAAIGQGMSAHCSSNMHQIYLAIFQWMQDTNQEEPFGNYNGTGDHPVWVESGIRPIDVLVLGATYNANAPNSAPDRDEDGAKWLDDASVFFCPQHGMDYGENFAPVAVRDQNLAPGTYSWIFRPRQFNYDPTYGGNYDRQRGYHDTLMIDTGGMMFGYGIGSLKGEHYNVLHYGGNVEVNFADSPAEMGEVLGAPGTPYNVRVD